MISENVVVVSFQRSNIATGISQQELAVVEFYKKKVEDDTAKILKTWWKGGEQFKSNLYSSMVEENVPEVAAESYILPFGVKDIAFTETKNHITGQNLIILTTNDQLYQLPHKRFTARRPLKGADEVEDSVAASFEVDEEEIESLEDLFKVDDGKKKPIKLKNKAFPKYDPILNKQSTSFVSYDLILSGMTNVVTFATNLESTSQVFAYGHDLFMVRVNPDRQYDLLQEDFPYSLLFVGIGGLILFNVFMRQYMKSHQARNTFLTS